MAAWQQLKTIPIKYPFYFGVVISTAKTSVSDLIVQKVVQQREEIDWKRNLTFATFGCFYLGGVQYALYVPIFSRIFPGAASFAAKSVREKLKDVKGMAALTGQVFIDQCVHHPLLYFPVFYCTKEIVMSDEPNVSRALSTCRENMGEDLKALWKIWVPSTFLNFAFMPMWGRIPWVAGTSFVWSMILSALRGGAVTEGDELTGTVTGESYQLLKASVNDFLASPVDLDRTLSHVCVSASGPDKIGWAAKLAGAVAELGGNVTHSKMVRLGQEFTILMHVSVRPEKKKKLVSGLYSDEGLEPLNLRVSSLTRRQTGMFMPATYGLRIHCVGEDRPGMLAAIAKSISGKGMSVENITTELRQGPHGRRDFVVNTDVTTTQILEEEGLDVLLKDIQKLKEQLKLDVLDIRVQKV